MRQIASLAAGAVVAAVGGLVLGEYPFIGWTPYVAGVLFALIVTEVMLSIGHKHGPILGFGGAALSAAGLGWAVWISSGRGVAPIPGGGWIAIALGAVVSLARGLLPGMRAAAGPPAPAATTPPEATPCEASRPEATPSEASRPEAARAGEPPDEPLAGELPEEAPAPKPRAAKPRAVKPGAAKPAPSPVRGAGSPARRNRTGER
jgi:hypothetical protein